MSAGEEKMTLRLLKSTGTQEGMCYQCQLRGISTGEVTLQCFSLDHCCRWCFGLR